jgi:hypothetical protein
MYFLKPGDRVIVALDHNRFNVEVVDLLGERVALLHGLSAATITRAMGSLSYQDKGRLWTCAQATRDILRPVQPPSHGVSLADHRERASA